MSTHTCELEVMYWIVEDSLYQGKTNRAEGMLNMLLYIAKYQPKMLQEGLRPVQIRRLKEITHELYDNVATQRREAITMRPPIHARQIPFKKEKELQQHLYENKGILENALEDKVRIVGVEVETDDDYRCDIVAESSNRCYPIELKIAQSTHAVVSQCSKYCYYFYRKLRYNHFKEIQGVVVANGFDSWSINELRREGHWIYEIVPEDKSVKLLRIHN